MNFQNFFAAHSSTRPQNFFNEVPTEIIRDQVSIFAKKADNLANQIISQETPKNYEGPVVIRSPHYYHSDPFFPLFYDSRPNVIYLNSSTTQRSSGVSQKQKKDNQAIAIAAVATVVGAVAIYGLGSGIAAYQDASAEFDETKSFQEKLNMYQYSANKEAQPLLLEAAQSAYLKERICSRLKNSALADIVLKTGMIASCSFGVAGYAAATPIFGTIALIGGAAATCGILFKWGFDNTDKANVRDAQSLKGSIKILNKI